MDSMMVDNSCYCC